MTVSSGAHLGTFLSEVCPNSNPSFIQRATERHTSNKVLSEPKGCSNLVKKTKEVTNASFTSAIALVLVGVFLVILILIALFVKAGSRENKALGRASKPFQDIQLTSACWRTGFTLRFKPAANASVRFPHGN
jgi:hypothetical protein